MPKLSEHLQHDINEFRDWVLTDPVEVLDPEGVIHHEFVDGAHGRKLDFDNIPTNSDFFIAWVAIYARFIRARFQNKIPDALVGIANGTNRLPDKIAPLLGKKVLDLTTYKYIETKSIQLDEKSLDTLKTNNVGFALLVEDVSTTGRTSSAVVEQLRQLDIPRIQVVSTWQRNPSLPYLDRKFVRYDSMIKEFLPMYTPDECMSIPEGFCAQGVALAPYTA